VHAIDFDALFTYIVLKLLINGINEEIIFFYSFPLVFIHSDAINIKG
jgi:hypothetical protein